jgi:hypothetical protein
MRNRRVEPRFLCADLVEVKWAQSRRAEIVNLDDISLSGACLLSSSKIPSGSEVLMTYTEGQLPGVVRYCAPFGHEYLIGMQFTFGCKWSSEFFAPGHLIDVEAGYFPTHNRRTQSQLPIDRTLVDRRVRAYGLELLRHFYTLQRSKSPQIGFDRLQQS